MKLSGWKNTLERIGIAAIVASLVFVGLQMRQEQEIAIVDTYGELSQSCVELTFKIGEQLEIWKKGLDGEQLTDEELGVFAVQAAAVGEFSQRVFIRWMRLGPIDPAVAASRFAYALYIFPGLRREYESAGQFSSSLRLARGSVLASNPFESAVNGYLEQFATENPAMPSEKPYIFWAI